MAVDDLSNTSNKVFTSLPEFERVWGSTVLNRTARCRRSFKAMNTNGAQYGFHPASWSWTASSGASVGPQGDVGTGRASVTSIRSSIARMKDGLDDANVTAYVQSIPLGHKVYLTWNHEVDNPSYQEAGKGWDAGTTFADYRQAMARWCGLVKAARGARDVTTMLTLTGWTYSDDPASTRDPLDYYPGPGTVEMIAPDPYYFAENQYRAFAHTITGAAEAWAFARDRGLRFGIAEWGCYDNASTDRPRWITEADTWMRTRYLFGPAVEFASWYHSSNESPNPTGTYVDSSPASVVAYQAHIDANA